MNLFRAASLQPLPRWSSPPCHSYVCFHPLSQREVVKPLTTTRAASFGLFGDIHFQEKGLERIKDTGDWLVQKFKEEEVDAIICLGDVLNTRETVSVRAQSAALDMFRKMRLSLPHIPIHVILGNHDMNLKHSRKISSLDALAIADFSPGDPRIFLHREIEKLTVAGENVVFIPYHQDQDDIVRKTADLVDSMTAEGLDPSSYSAFGHLSVVGAKQNTNGAAFLGTLHPSTFTPFKRTFSGHFHSHHTLGDREEVVYVGSPLQLNFGDAGASRGIVIYDSVSDKYKLHENPHASQFIVLTEAEAQQKFEENQFQAKFVRLQFSRSVSANYFA
eukprot:TRINITY_DN9750_c0_g1_i1.p1 TRINITY_DN9750_c0_g1~~TRINITY_DN9750_c0_g1_i1.p1  ORF type:complete len:332 (+),score=59.67 TRINITY_DN9750_c0_g1_i1:95-1090(+)